MNMVRKEEKEKEKKISKKKKKTQGREINNQSTTIKAKGNK